MKLVLLVQLLVAVPVRRCRTWCLLLTRKRCCWLVNVRSQHLLFTSLLYPVLSYADSSFISSFLLCSHLDLAFLLHGSFNYQFHYLTHHVAFSPSHAVPELASMCFTQLFFLTSLGASLSLKTQLPKMSDVHISPFHSGSSSFTKSSVLGPDSVHFGLFWYSTLDHIAAVDFLPADFVFKLFRRSKCPGEKFFDVIVIAPNTVMKSCKARSKSFVLLC